MYVCAFVCMCFCMHVYCVTCTLPALSSCKEETKFNLLPGKCHSFVSLQSIPRIFQLLDTHAVIQ